MTLEEMLDKYYGGPALISIEKKDGSYLVEEEEYNYYCSNADDYDLSDNNPNHYKPKWIGAEEWWAEAKDREVLHWNILSNPAELLIGIDL